MFAQLNHYGGVGVSLLTELLLVPIPFAPSQDYQLVGRHLLLVHHKMDVSGSLVVEEVVEIAQKTCEERAVAPLEGVVSVELSGNVGCRHVYYSRQTYPLSRHCGGFC